MSKNPLTLIMKTNKFNGTNYNDWLRNLRIVLDFENQGYILDKPLPTALPEGSSSEERVTFDKWLEDNRKVHSIILTSMTNEVQKQYDRLEDVPSIMLRIKDVYAVPDRLIRYAATKVFFGTKMAEGSSVQSHGVEMLSLVEKLEDLKAGLDNDTYIDVILQSLPPSYDPFIINYNMNGLEKSIHELINMLVQYEATTRKSEPAVLVGEVSTSKAKGKSARRWKRKKGKGTAVKATASTEGAPPAARRERAKGRLGVLSGRGQMICAFIAMKRGIGRGSVHNSSLTQVLQRSRKLSKDEMILRLGDGKAVAAEAVGSLSLVIWHARLGHISKDRIRRLIDSKSLEIDDLDHLPTCESCLKGKMTKKPFVGQSAIANGLLDLVHTDVCGPLSVPDRGGFSYFITFTDDHSRYGYVYLMRYKSEAFGRFKEYRLEVENQTNRKIKALRSDRGGEYLIELPPSFWGHALETAVKLLNIAPSKSVPQTSYEIWHGKPASYKYLRVWGSPICQEASGRQARFEESSGESPHNSTTSFEPTVHTDSVPVLRRSTRESRVPERYGFVGLTSQLDNDPKTYREAMSDIDSDKWLEAIKSEMDSMGSNQVWTLVNPPKGVRPVGCKWVYKRKLEADGEVTAFKARLVAKGYTQRPEVNFEETYSPVAMAKSIRILLAIAAWYDYEIWQMDVKMAFLNGVVEEEIFMDQPEGFTTKISGSSVAYLVLYVDDILLIGNDVKMLRDIKAWLSTQFSMKDMGEASYILGIKIYRDRSRRMLGLTQSSYIEKVLKRFMMEHSKRGLLPMRHGIKLSKKQSPKTDEELKRMSDIPYASAVGSIQYAVQCTRPDVVYALSVTSRYQACTGERTGARSRAFLST
ncbi:UNVERIFIED_CONTAM: Retrovirus-related Pol polyprotein from transposon TNT 1-94 [Sesamum latifolium]|uniref:Retrovirus-related Pol polyprotein from transposon TNT 1-94 n=1 Tax=Sesamum latifolium TaxID=2727402 RepID=A0AAW2SS75_9LAMI